MANDFSGHGSDAFAGPLGFRPGDTQNIPIEIEVRTYDGLLSLLRAITLSGTAHHAPRPSFRFEV